MPKLVIPKTDAEKAAEKQKEEEEGRQAIIDAAPRETCPFLGVMHTIGQRQASHAEQMAGAPPMLPGLQGIFIPCLREKCAFWNEEASTPCTVRGGFEAMARVDAARRSTSAGFTVKP